MMIYLTQQQPPPNAPEFGGSSPIGLVVILALFVVTFFLVRSMNKHLKKVPASFEPPDEQAADQPSEEPEDGPRTTTAQ
jgi:hypothetical protein